MKLSQQRPSDEGPKIHLQRVNLCFIYETLLHDKKADVQCMT